MDGQIDRRLDGQTDMDRQTDRWLVGWMDGWLDRWTLLLRSIDASKQARLQMKAETNGSTSRFKTFIALWRSENVKQE